MIIVKVVWTLAPYRKGGVNPCCFWELASGDAWFANHQHSCGVLVAGKANRWTSPSSRLAGDCSWYCLQWLWRVAGATRGDCFAWPAGQTARKRIPSYQQRDWQSKRAAVCSSLYFQRIEAVWVRDSWFCKAGLGKYDSAFVRWVKTFSSCFPVFFPCCETPVLLE